VVLQFAGRSGRNSEEALEFPIASLATTLCDVRGY
jgi:hypothetical protein